MGVLKILMLFSVSWFMLHFGYTDTAATNTTIPYENNTNPNSTILIISPRTVREKLTKWCNYSIHREIQLVNNMDMRTDDLKKSKDIREEVARDVKTFIWKIRQGLVHFNKGLENAIFNEKKFQNKVDSKEVRLFRFKNACYRHFTNVIKPTIDGRFENITKKYRDNHSTKHNQEKQLAILKEMFEELYDDFVRKYEPDNTKH